MNLGSLLPNDNIRAARDIGSIATAIDIIPDVNALHGLITVVAARNVVDGLQRAEVDRSVADNLGCVATTEDRTDDTYSPQSVGRQLYRGVVGQRDRGASGIIAHPVGDGLPLNLLGQR